MAIEFLDFPMKNAGSFHIVKRLPEIKPSIHQHNNGKSPFLMGKSTINHPGYAQIPSRWCFPRWSRPTPRSDARSDPPRRHGHGHGQRWGCGAAPGQLVLEIAESAWKMKINVSDSWNHEWNICKLCFFNKTSFDHDENQHPSSVQSSVHSEVSVWRPKMNVTHKKKQTIVGTRDEIALKKMWSSDELGQGMPRWMVGIQSIEEKRGPSTICDEHLEV